MNKENLPQHVVIVPDGNRRWAKKRGIAPWRGHIAGAKRGVEQIEAALDLGIKCLSIWGGSYGNLTKRSKIEINVLFRIYESYLRKLIKRKELHDNKVRVSVIGRWPEVFPKSAIKAAREVMDATKDYNNHYLSFFLAYDGAQEMLAAVRDMVKEARVNKNLKVTPELLKSYLWSGHLPVVDFLIRTGSYKDPHNSAGFMMWHTANSQLYYAKESYPDFSREKFIQAIKEYQRRERRLGK